VGGVEVGGVSEVQRVGVCEVEVEVGGVWVEVGGVCVEVVGV